MEIIINGTDGSTESFRDLDLAAITFKPHSGQDIFEPVTICPGRNGVEIEVGDMARILSESIAANRVIITGEPV